MNCCMFLGGMGEAVLLLRSTHFILASVSSDLWDSFFKQKVI